jgi:1,4-alpha-glucan branching enzyme
MISCDTHPDRLRVNVTFKVVDPDRTGHQINVVGDFNDWNPGATQMAEHAQTHTATVALHPGRRYRFRYLSNHDGWFNDDTAGWYEFNEFGQKNCVLDLAILDLDTLRRRTLEPSEGERVTSRDGEARAG